MSTPNNFVFPIREQSKSGRWATVKNLYGRLGTEADVEKQVTMAKAAQGQIKRDAEAGTVTATLDGEVLFRAIRKGEPGQPWIVMYNAKYYPQS